MNEIQDVRSGSGIGRRVTLVAVDAQGSSAVGSRIGAFATGLRAHGWEVDRIDLERAAPSRAERCLDLLPAPVRGLLERAGIEGDVMPRTGKRIGECLDSLVTGIVMVSAPPFSLLWEAAKDIPESIPLVLDYRDPWNARLSPPLLACATRHLERRALQRAAAVTYAGDPFLGRLLCEVFKLPPERVVSIPNGFDPQDLEDVPPWRQVHRDGTPLNLVFGGYWYGRNGPGVLVDALARVGPSVASLTVIGSMAPSIERQSMRALGHVPVQQEALPRSDLYRRLARADAAVITLDHASAIESRIPAKCYDCLAVGVPVIAVCPDDAAILRVAGAERFHHIDHHDRDGLVHLLRLAAQDRAVLRHGQPSSGPTRQDRAAVLARLLEQVARHRRTGHH